MMWTVAGIGVLAFGVSGGLLIAFLKSLMKEDRNAETQFTRRSGVLLVATIASLLFFSLLFVAIAFLG